MQTYAVYFYPRGPSASVIGSDTLFGAVCWGLRVLDLVTDLDAWLDGPAPSFAFSSALPAWYNRDGAPMLRLYPLPETFGAVQTDVEALAGYLRESKRYSERQALLESTRQAKRFKSVAYLSESLFTQVVDNTLQPGQALLALAAEKPKLVQVGNILLSKVETDALVAEGVNTALPPVMVEAVQHNSVDRVAGATVEGLLFYKNEVYFAPQAGYWALLRASEADLQKLILPALRYLEDTGLGGSRTTGKGHYKIRVEPAPALPAAANPNGVMLLSRYLPAENDGIALQGAPLAYRLITLRPRREQKFPQAISMSQTAPVYKQPLRVFEPGSVFPLRKAQEIYGAIARVVPPGEGAPAHQSGAALPVFIHIRESVSHG